MQPRSAGWYRQTYTDLSTSGIVNATGTGLDNAVAVPSANHTIFVQRITFNSLTSAAQTITFKDDNSTALTVLFIEASVAAGTIRTVDFGARGFALTQGKNLDLVNAATGPAYSWAVEAYAKQTATFADTSVARTI